LLPFLVASLAAGLTACSVAPRDELAVSRAAAGWQPLLGAAAVELPGPPAPGSAEAEADRAAVAAWATRLAAPAGAPDREAVRRWLDADPARLWAAEARRLVGTFDLVDPARAARVLAYAQAAAYDALVATWAQKQRYARIGPDGRATGLPSYPSEHAAVAVACAGVLAALLPDQAAGLAAKAQAVAEVPVAAGVAFPSDVAAGRAVGEAVAAAAIARLRAEVAAIPGGQAEAGAAGAASDREQDEAGAAATASPREQDEAGTAGAASDRDQAAAGAPVAAAPARPAGAWPGPPAPLPAWQDAWPISQEAGGWRGWTDGAAASPPPPPDAAQVATELAALVRANRGIGIRERAIALKWHEADMARHWSERAAELAGRWRLPAPDAARVLAFTAIAGADAAIASFRAQYRYARPRPIALAPALEPVIATPGHPAYPSDGAAMATAAAGYLATAFPAEAAGLAQEAQEASEAGRFAGWELSSDVAAGRAIGAAVAAAVAARAGADGTP